MAENAEIVFKHRPGFGESAVEDDFAYVKCSFPEDPGDGQVIIKTLYLSADPCQRIALKEDYTPPVETLELGSVVFGVSGLGSIVKSSSSQFVIGDIVRWPRKWPWRLFFLCDASSLRKVPISLSGGRLTPWMSVFGGSGLTSLYGVREKGHIKRGANQTFVVSGAAGACGSLAGQVARLEGCGRVIGICGSDDKCRFLTEDLKFDVAINYRTQNVSEELKKACPNGIDIYFDNVGGEISNAVVQQMNKHSHVILSGQISQYNYDIKFPFPVPNEIRQIVEDRHITRESFFCEEYRDRQPELIEQMNQWMNDGKIIICETIEEGLENAPKAFVKMMTGGNIGKQLIHVADP